jgi:hypothetical protein
MNSQGKGQTEHRSVYPISESRSSAALENKLQRKLNESRIVQG